MIAVERMDVIFHLYELRFNAIRLKYLPRMNITNVHMHTLKKVIATNDSEQRKSLCLIIDAYEIRKYLLNNVIIT